MYEETIKVFAMRCEAGRAFKGRIEEIPNNLEAEQDFVGGYISVISLTEEIDIIANEEGKLQDLPLNRAWVDDKGKVLDIIVGNVCACRHDDNGNFTSVFESDVPVIIKRLPAIMSILDKTIFLRVEEDLPVYGCEEWKLGESCVIVDESKNIIEAVIVSKMSDVLYGVMDKAGNLYQGEPCNMFRNREDAEKKIGGHNE